jgi:hypothetical protein
MKPSMINVLNQYTEQNRDTKHVFEADFSRRGLAIAWPA